MTSKKVINRQQSKEIQDINYFEFMYKLRFFEDKLRNKGENENIEVILSEIMSYIFSNLTLKTMYNKQLNVFLDYENDNNYKEIYLAEYKKFKIITKKIMSKGNKRSNYLSNNQEEISETSIDQMNQKIADMPLIYFYPTTKILSKYCISDSIKEFYKIIDFRYENIIIPENIEFYISLVFSYKSLLGRYKNTYMENFVISYLTTSILYVLKNLQKIINKIIDEECFDDHGIVILKEIEEQDKLFTLTLRNDKNFYIDGKKFELSPSLAETLTLIAFGGDIPEDKNIKNSRKTYVNRINQLANKEINQYIIVFDNKQKRHTLADNIKAIDCSNR